MHAAALKSRWGLSLMLYDDLRHSGSRQVQWPSAGQSGDS